MINKWQQTLIGAFLFIATIGMAYAADKNNPANDAATQIQKEYKWIAFVYLTRNQEEIVWLRDPPDAQKVQLEHTIKNFDGFRPVGRKKLMKGLMCANPRKFRTLWSTDGKIAVDEGERINFGELRKALELLEKE